MYCPFVLPFFLKYSFDKCSIPDQQLVCFDESSDDLQYFCLHTALTMREECWIKFCMQLITVICLDNICTLFYCLPPKSTVSYCYCLGNSALFQTEWIILWISEHTSLPFASVSYENIWSVPGDLSFEICISHFLLKGTCMGINGSAVCISVCLT